MTTEPNDAAPAPAAADPYAAMTDEALVGALCAGVTQATIDGMAAALGGEPDDGRATQSAAMDRFAAGPYHEIFRRLRAGATDRARATGDTERLDALADFVCTVETRNSDGYEETYERDSPAEEPFREWLDFVIANARANEADVQRERAEMHTAATAQPAAARPPGEEGSV